MRSQTSRQDSASPPAATSRALAHVNESDDAVTSALESSDEASSASEYRASSIDRESRDTHTGAEESSDEAPYEGNLRPFHVYIHRVQNTWRQFCHQILLTRRWKNRLQELDFKTVYDFLFWAVDQRTGRGGIRSKSSLMTFWHGFRTFYKRQMLANIPIVIDISKVANAMRKTGRSLKTEKRNERCMSVEDLKSLIETTFCTTAKAFKLGELRVLVVLFLLLLASTSSRPAAILALTFGDIHISLMRDPNGGPNYLVISCTFNRAKTYRGEKESITFPLPEVIFDPSLLLSPHVFMLAMLLQCRAFSTEHLNDDIHALDKLQIHPGSNELRLTLKKKLRNVPLFRQAEKTVASYEMLTKVAITNNMMTKLVRHLGNLTGFKSNTSYYNLRFMVGNKHNNPKMNQPTNFSDSLRSPMMGHAPLSDTFQKHYLNRADKQAAIKIQLQMLGQECMQPVSAEHHSQRSRPMSTAQRKVIEALTVPLVNDLEAQHVRRAKAVMALMGYCGVEEPLTTKPEAKPPPSIPEL